MTLFEMQEGEQDRRSGKSESAFRTISEVSDELDVPQHVLRFWESKFTQIKPLKRGGGRRYYRPEDVQLLRRIRDLLYEDRYTIKGVQKLLKENGGKLPPSKEEQEASASEQGQDETAAAPLETSLGTEISGPDRAEMKAILDELISLRKLLAKSSI